MKAPTLKATPREILGQKTRFLRRQGITPTHLFGHGLESLALQCTTADLQDVISQAGRTTLLDLAISGEKKPRKVLIREIQKDVFGRRLLHVDFYQVRSTEKLKADIPIVLEGAAPALKLKGRFLMQALNALSIECLPDKLLHEITVDLSGLEEVEQAIHIKDLVLDPDITIINDPNQLIVKVSEKVAVEEEVAAEEEVLAEGEAAEVTGAEAEAKPEEPAAE
ncbi:50S ribosomal protein L25 [Chloroflexota bacterium]